MKNNLFILLAVLLIVTIAYGGKSETKPRTSPVILTAYGLQRHTFSYFCSKDTTDEMTATYFVVVADTGRDYGLLHHKMLDLNKRLHISIDTLNRSYNPAKELIALPDNDADEIYAGDYFPRRFPGHFLSLEYLDFYQLAAGDKTMALVTGIYETKKSADSVLTLVQKAAKKAFTLKADIYVGCMH